LDLKLGIGPGPKVGNFLSGKREAEGEREIEIEGRDRWEK
jgi:hypothetical protein